ncbi:MAG: hypothetical protein SNJ29_08490 [Rikenellaceae bacterium]
MKRSLAILFAILSLSIFFNIERGCNNLYGESEVQEVAVEDTEQSFSQGDNYIDLSGRQGSSSTVSTAKVLSKNNSSRRNLLDLFSGVRIAIASLYSECSYSYSCDFPFEHFPQRELFFILRNIRI